MIEISTTHYLLLCVLLIGIFYKVYWPKEIDFSGRGSR